MIALILSILIFVFAISRWLTQYEKHQAHLDQVQIRIHVNGIRGKSTVTRLLGGMLREGGFNTLSKTTGSAARIIMPDGSEIPIIRYGAPTIVEQMNVILEHVTEDTDAMVMECMAVNPVYQKITQEQIVKGNITVITNVREDHQDVMGESLEEIAHSLSNTIPENGILITAEDRPHLREILKQNALIKQSQFIYADPATIHSEDLQHFDYLSFKENLAIGLKIAELLDIPREVAIKGMAKSIPDIGSIFIRKAEIHQKDVIWAPLFAVNDRESSIIGINALEPYHDPDATRIGILNNRYDRAVRATQFAEIAAVDLQLDYYITFGAYEKQVSQRMIECGYPAERIINLGDSVNPSLDDILHQVTDLIEGTQGVLIGLVNIHTDQAELLMEYFHHPDMLSSEENVLLANIFHAPVNVQRQRMSFAHLLHNTLNG